MKNLAQVRYNDGVINPPDFLREDSGNAGLVARELPSDEVLASWQHVEQRALDLRAAGMCGSLRELRIRAYLDLLQERDSRLAAGTAPGQDRGPGKVGDLPDGPATCRTGRPGTAAQVRGRTAARPGPARTATPARPGRTRARCWRFW
jgi:hypothetical protein